MNPTHALRECETRTTNASHSAWEAAVGGANASTRYAPLDSISCLLVRTAKDPEHVFMRELQQRHGYTAAQARAALDHARL